MQYTLQQNKSLPYIIQKPNLLQPTNQSIIILIHGFGSNEQDLISLAPSIAGNHVFVSVRGPVTINPNQFAWFNVQFNGSQRIIDSEQAQSSGKLLIEFINQISQEFDTDNVTLLGFSQGAMMSYDIVFSGPNLINKVIALGGRILDQTKAKAILKTELKTPNVLIAHGNQDQTVPIYFAGDAEEFLSSLNIKNVLKTYPIGHTISQAQIDDITNFINQT
jgi:phospholipase/carboxylesterase